MSAWAEDGALTAASWLSHRAPVTTAAARQLVRDARLVHGNEATAKALSAGEISTAHVNAAARAARHVEDLYGDHEAGIVDAARSTSPDEFRTVIAHWRSLAEDLAGKEPAAARFERRHLHLSPILDSMTRIDGWIDAEAGALLANTLDALEPPDPTDGPEPPRTLSRASRRRTGQARLGEQGAGAQRSPIVLDVDTIQGRSPTDLTTARCDLLGGEPIDYSTAVRMACDATVTRVVTKGAGTILDLGRSTPVVSAAQRKALALRDRGCVEPGCTAPPEWCDAHHKWHWIQGGPTDLWNLELRCRRHHIKAHRDTQRPRHRRRTEWDGASTTRRGASRAGQERDDASRQAASRRACRSPLARRRGRLRRRGAGARVERSRLRRPRRRWRRRGGRCRRRRRRRR